MAVANSDSKSQKASPISPSCLNHLKHGATATTLFLDDENPAVFFELLEDAFEENQPASKQSAGIVTRTVHDQWILLRRERACDNFEAALHAKKPHPVDWMAAELHAMELLDRYRTAAARSYSRSLNDLFKLKKTKASEDRWRLHFELQKSRFDLDLERFNLAKQKQKQKETSGDIPEPDPLPDTPFSAPPPSSSAPSGSCTQQTLFIGEENNETIIYEVTPSNEELSRTLSEGDKILRTYNFVGSVPPEYKHLITPDAVTWGKSTSVQKTYSFSEWQKLT